MLTTALTLILSVTAFAQDARDLRGQAVDLSDQPTVVVFWSMHDADSTAAIGEAREAADGHVRVVAVNVDGVSARSSLRPFARARGLEAPGAVLVADADGSLARRYAATSGTVVLTADGAVAQWGGGAAAVARRAATQLRDQGAVTAR